MQLIIAEKPSVARAIAGAVGACERRDGYLEGGGYAVTWCRGHLVDLADPGEYPGWEGPWDLGKLPMIPDPWRWAPSMEDGAARQLRVIGRLAGRADIEAVINACDADREGEGIFRRVYGHIGCSKPVLRFWSTSLTDDAIRKDLGRMADGSAYDGLGAAAEGRAKADWLVGMNGTRAYTKAHGSDQVLSVGRVQTPVLSMVVERTRRVEGFKPTAFWCVTADLGGFSVESDRFDAEGPAEGLAQRAARAGKGRVTLSERKDVRAAPPALYDLTSLQRDASTRCGLTADATLSALQSLYERRLATYPRADSKYITADDAAEASALLPRIAQAGIVGDEAARAYRPERADISRVVNDKKVVGHSAILPTPLLDAEAMGGLSGAERQVMELVCCRLLAAVMEPGTRTHRKVSVEIAGAEFTASGSTVKDASWIAVDDACKHLLAGGGEEREQAEAGCGSVPDLSQGDEVEVLAASVREGRTSPPKHFTDATLLSAMENAGRDIDDAELKAAIADDSSHSAGLGTPATRADIIKRLISKGFAQRKGRSIIATQKGRQLIDVVADSLKSPVLTAEWESQLSAIEHGGGDLGRFVSGIEDYARDIVGEAVATADASAFRRAAEPVGTCPLCGKPVVPCRSGKAWRCSDQRWEKREDGSFTQAGACTLYIGKVAGKQLTEKQARALVAGKTVPVKGLKSKAGKTFGANLRLDGSGRIEFVFGDNGKKGKA